MARFTRRRFGRRFNGLWFPVAGAMALDQIAALAPGTTNNMSRSVLGGALDEPIDTTNFPLATLEQYARQGYVVKRLLGNAFIWVTGTFSGDPVLVNLSLVSAKCDDAGAILDIAQYNNFTNIFLSRQQHRQVWSRNWALMANNVVAGAAVPPMPASNVDYGSVREGCFIDTKGSQVRVEAFHKLFFILSAFNTSANVVDVNMRLKVRAFGKVTSTHQGG